MTLRDSTSYLLINGGLQELNWFKQSYGSWFMGDYICEDGGLYAATPVDPVFILLPMFDQARMKNGNDPGKFRQLDEIIYIHDYPGYRCLSTIAESSMQIVCDFKEIGSTKFFRLNDSKVLAWMLCKVQQLKQTLVKLDKNYAARSEKEICTVCETYMCACVCVYARFKKMETSFEAFSLRLTRRKLVAKRGVRLRRY
ncbi:putative ribonuclease H2 subunit B, wHTH domain-containing protein [Helianthus annuus]|nr:putative ribonuclease H2 subunit B, wHTH domain-containing protein [Helianthus annuus]